MNRSVNEYEYRNRIIERMGYGSYCHYLRSGLWRQIRRTVLVDNPLCLVCRKLATQVHHRTYTAHNLTGITTDGLVALCEKCHSEIEHDECGRKLFGGDVDRKLEAMVADAEHVRTHGMKRVKVREAVKRCTDCGKEMATIDLTHQDAIMSISHVRFTASQDYSRQRAPGRVITSPRVGGCLR